MSELGDLLVGLSVLIGSIASAFVLVWNTIRSSRQPKHTARKAAEESASAVLDAVADGQITPEEIADIQRTLRHEGDQ